MLLLFALTSISVISYYYYSYYIKNTSNTYKKQERSLHKTLLTYGDIHPNSGPFMEFSQIRKNWNTTTTI